MKESVVDEATNFNYLGSYIQTNLGWKSLMLAIIANLRICFGMI